MKSYIFKAVIEEDPYPDGRMAYHAYIPILQEKGASTFGYTPEEALENLREVTQLVLESLLKHGEPIPEGPAEEVEVFTEPLVVVALAS
jgi:predicted RNase H-like HicB family nuclease